METITDYALTTLYIKEHLDKIQEFARGFFIGLSAQDKEDGDIFQAWNDRVDLNFVKSPNNRWVCFAYPVVNGYIDCSSEHEVKIPLNVKKESI
jgi:hypothetical protein